MGINNDLAEKQIRNQIISKHEIIKVKSGKTLFNYQCQYNSVSFAKKKKDKKIAMCVCERHGEVFIHFVNYHKKKFIDNTLGQWSEIYNYYFIKFIDKEDFWDIDDIFTAYRKELRKSLSWLVRLTSNFKA